MWDRVRVTVAPTALAVTVAEAKSWIRVDTSVDDTVIEMMLRSAIAAVDGPSGIGWAMMAQTWALSLDAFSDEIRLPGAPVKAVTSIAYVDADGATQTLDSGDYQVDVAGDVARICPVYGGSWPSTRLQNAAVTVTYTLGESSSANVPANLRTAVLLLAAHLYQNREAVSGEGLSELPLGVAETVREYRRNMVTA